MRTIAVLLIAALAALCLFPLMGDTGARAGGGKPVARFEPLAHDTELDGQYTQPRAAAQDTFLLAYFTWDSGPNCVTENWVSVDRTAQTGDYWHVDDFAGLAGGDTGLLAPLEGTRSMWCGTRPSAVDPVVCSYATPPGYGNNWDQTFRTKECLAVGNNVEVHVTVAWDSEPGYDYTTLEIDNCDDNWQPVYGGPGTWDGTGNGTLSITVPDGLHAGPLRVRFHFESDDTRSDEDGLYPTDGAFILDELSVTDINGVVLAPETFEDEALDAHESDDWMSEPVPGYGDFAALYHGLTVLQEDRCYSDLTCLWGFFSGSIYDYTCGGFPAQATVPYMNSRGQTIHNEVWSPAIPVIGAGTSWELQFDVYRDLRCDALVFYTWHVRSIVGGCPGGWRDDGFVYHGNGKDWFRATHQFGQYIETPAEEIQVALGVRDMCKYWCGTRGTGQCHSHAPLFDNCRVYRVNTAGPMWAVRDADLFQDNFSDNGTITGSAHADAAVDILPRSSPAVLPGDSASVSVADPVDGINSDPVFGGPAVYCYVSIDGPNAAAGAAVVDDTRYPYVGDTAAAGRTWHSVRMDSVRTPRGGVVPDRYCVDLNDNLFVPGDTVWFFFGAENSLNQWTYFSQFVPTRTGETDDLEVAAGHPDEFTILPGGGFARGGDVLYVNGMNNRGARPFFDTSFEMIDGLDGLVDRYDIRAASSCVGNHPASRVKDIAQQLVGVYRKILWNCGNLETAFSDGSPWLDKSDDQGLLFNFLDMLMETGGVYMSGDDVADVIVNRFATGGATMRSTYINFNLGSGDHVDSVGVSPKGIGRVSGIFSDGVPANADTLVCFGGCPLINDFDILQATGLATVEMKYHGDGRQAGAIVAQKTPKSVDTDVGFVLSGFSFHYIRDDRAQGIPDRAVHLYRIVTWLENAVGEPVAIGRSATAKNELRQNYPNPFNPTTTIRYQVRTGGRVLIRVYNIAGQLVRTLVDGPRKAGVIHEVEWKGLNDAGQPVASGVYFYKLAAPGYTETRKMVLLK